MRQIACSEDALVLQMKRTALMRSASDAVLCDVARETVLLECSRGEIVCREDERADAIHLLLSGGLKVVHLLSDGTERVLYTVGEGAPADVECLFRQETHNASVIGLTTSTLLRIERNAFMQAVRRDSALSFALVGVLALRVKMLTKRLGVHGTGSLQRLAGFLLHRFGMEGSESIQLGMTREDVASALGIVRETLSRSLSRLAAEGVVSISGRRIDLLDRTRLARIAGAAGGSSPQGVRDAGEVRRKEGGTEN